MLASLLSQIKECSICEEQLPLGCRPVLSASTESKILVIGQAPGIRVHNSGVPWDDPSGVNLRKWLQVDKVTFYNPTHFAIIPMGFCYPGTGKSGDLPPRKECAPHWHNQLLELMPNIKLSLLIGQYAQKYYLKKEVKKNLTETVRAYHEYLPNYCPLPHPSPRNNIWQKKNQWFKQDVLPNVGKMVANLLAE